MNLMVMLEYRGDFVFWGAVSVMWTVFHFFFLSLLVNANGSISGWSRDEIFVLMSIYTIYDAFTWSFFYFNMQRYMRRVFTGELDMFLLKPVDAQFMLSVEHNSYNNLFRLVIGIGMLVFSLSRLQQSITVLSFVLFLILLLFGFILLYSIWFFIATFAFWVERLNNLNDVIPSLRKLSQFPRSVYTGISSFLFCIVFPIVLITSIPAETLMNKSSLGWNIYFMASSIAMFWLARRFFFFSIKKYSGAGS